MKALNIDELKAKAKVIRKHIITSTTEAGSGHPTSSLSGVEIATALYFGGILRYDSSKPKWPERDRFILSKGHAAPLLYAILAEAGYFSTAELPTLRKLGSPLEGHPNYRRLAGVEASTGSLGQGLSIGLGHVLGTRLDGYDSKTYVMLGDGEIAEGQIWEAVMAAGKYEADHLIAIVDQNGYQQTGATKDVLDLKPLAPKFAAFGWHTQEINGNDMQEAFDALKKTQEIKDKPSVIIADTVKGWPIQDVIGDKNHHGQPLSEDQAKKALEAIGV